MAAGQQVLSRTLDVAALNRAEASLADGEAVRGAAHARQLRDVLALHRLNAAAGLELSTVPQVALVLSCSEHRAAQLLGDALALAPLTGAMEALDCGLLTVEHSRRLVDALQPLPFTQRLDVWHRLQARLTDSDTVLPPEPLAELLRLWVIQTEPAGATERRQQAENDGAVDSRRRADGLVDLHLTGANSPQAHAALANIRRHAAPFSADDPRPADKRRLDAALDLLCGRSPLVFHNDDDGQHCRPGCDCRPGQPAPCGADLTVLVPLGAALGNTDELAELVGHGPLEPDLLDGLLHSAPVLRAVFVDQ